jgi:iron-sulfur cluster assembly protein
MLALTETATTVIRSVIDHPELPDGAGLRIAASSGDTTEGLTVAAAPTPEEGDQVLETEGARVFLEPTAAAILDEMVLDARVDDEGRPEFLVAAQ